MRSTLFHICLACGLLATLVAGSAFTRILTDEIGMAAWYSDSLDGRPTASGEKYDKNAYTCAHKSLPFGTKVRVTRLDNNLSVIVRVNDRGPSRAGYIVDVSHKAAEAIGLVRDGSARVKLEVVETANGAPQAAVAPPPVQYHATPAVKSSSVTLIKAKDAPAAPRTMVASSPQKGVATKGLAQSAPAPRNTELYKIGMQKMSKHGFAVQVSTMSDADNVFPVVSKIEQSWPGKANVTINSDESAKLPRYKVLIGPFADRKSAEAQQKIAEKKGFAKCFIVDLSTI